MSKKKHLTTDALLLVGVLFCNVGKSLADDKTKKFLEVYIESRNHTITLSEAEKEEFLRLGCKKLKLCGNKDYYLFINEDGETVFISYEKVATVLARLPERKNTIHLGRTLGALFDRNSKKFLGLYY